MKLEDQVVSIELAKRLKELGVKQDSLFVWYIKMQVPFVNYLPTIARDQDDDEIASAFTVAELGEMLPHAFQDYWNIISHRGSSGMWFCTLYDFSTPKHPLPHYMETADGYVIEFRCETEADARAKMLIHLIEKGIVKP